MNLVQEKYLDRYGTYFTSNKNDLFLAINSPLIRFEFYS